MVLCILLGYAAGFLLGCQVYYPENRINQTLFDVISIGVVLCYIPCYYSLHTSTFDPVKRKRRDSTVHVAMVIYLVFQSLLSFLVFALLLVVFGWDPK